MKILFAASEASPFFVADGPGVMTGGLPPALRRRQAEIRAVLPLYEDLSGEWREKLVFITSFVVPVGWRSQYCGLFELTWQDMTWYFLDNEYYFKRAGLYGFYDDGERFAFFSRAVLETLFHVDFAPDIVHCNDWQTALVPVYLNLYYRNIEKFASIKTVFTIHDIRRQCTYGSETLEETLGIGRENMHILEYRGAVNLTKGAIEAADVISTVSPTYAREILDPVSSCGLDDFLQKKQGKLYGILNGIDISGYSPLTDPHIAANYGLDDFSEGKRACKEALREEFGLECDRAPLFAVASPFTEDRGLGLLLDAAEDLVGYGVQLVVMGYGGKEAEDFFSGLAHRRAGKAGTCIGFDRVLERQIYAGSDVFLLPSQMEPCGFEQMAALRYGAVPVARRTGGLRDTIRDNAEGTGNGFTFDAYTSRDMLGACLRAKDVYHREEAWTGLVRRAMRCDNSWSTSATRYIDMYQRTLCQLTY